MLDLISNKVAKIRHNLSSLDDHPVGKASLAILIFLDIFILISIFDGLSDHTRQLTGPDQYIPQYCRDIVIEGSWNETTRLDELAQIVSDSRNSYYLEDGRERTQERHAICKPITQFLLSIEDDAAVSQQLKQLLKAKREIGQLNLQLENINSAFGTSLLQDIAQQNEGRADVDSLRKEVAVQTDSLNTLVDIQSSLAESLEQDKRISAFFELASGLTEADRAKLRNDLRQLNFWYPVKRLGMEMIFLLPLFLVFYLWNVKSIAARRPFQTLVSSHLLVIVFIPVLFKIIDMVYTIIPKKLLKNLIELLESLKLVALWHYLMMAVIILLALAVIYLFQKKLFSHEKLIEKRISKGACQNCGKHLPVNTPACPFCGFGQFKQCSSCDKPTYVFSKFCKECGHSDD